MGGSEMSETEKTDGKASETEGKIPRSLESMLKQMQLSDDEMKYRMDNFDNVDVVKEYLKYLKCTRCNKNFQNVIRKGDSVGIHPLLGVLMCDSCCEYYGDGDFSLDSEGEDKYCRWCGEGGTIFACSKCICGFCDVCIKKHFGEKGLEAVEKDDDWICYFCNPQPLWYLRSICSLATEAAKSKRENIKKVTNLKKKRRKIDSLENELNGSSSDSSSISSYSSSDSPRKRKSKRKRLKRLEKGRRDESSSSEDEKENHVSSKKRPVRSKKPAAERDEDEESEAKKRKSKMTEDENEFENKRDLIVEKFKSIWKLTQTITEVGLSSSRDKLRNLSRSKRYTLENLRQEHEDLKSCMKVLVSSLNTASNSVDSIKEDLTFDTTNSDRENFRGQETKLKTFAEKFHKESNGHTSVNSEGDSFRKEIKEKKGKDKESVKGTRKSVREMVKESNRESDKNSEEKKNSGGEDKSMSLFSDSGSDKEKKERNSGKEEKQNGEKGCDHPDKNSATVKPLLKVKSFARMLHENAYDQNKSKEKTPIDVIEIDIDIEESEKESKEKESPNGKDGNAANGVGKETEKEVIEEEDKGTPKKDNELEKLTEREEKTGKSSSESEAEKQKGDKREGKKNASSDSESKGETKKRRTRRNRKKGGKQKSSDSESEVETKKRKTRQKKKKVEMQKSSESGNESSASETGKSSVEKKTAAVREGKQKGRSVLENSDSSGSEKSKSSDSEKEKQPTPNKSPSQETVESSNEKEQLENRKNDKEGSSEKLREENKESDAADGTTTTDEDDDSCEKAKKKSEEKEKSEEESEDSRSKKKKKGSKINSDNEKESGKNSSSSEGEENEKSPTKDKKGNSSDSDGKSSTDNEKNKRKTRGRKKRFEVSFEKFKRKRERFLKTSKENPQPETEKEEPGAIKALESSESENENDKKEDKKTERKAMKRTKRRLLASSDEEGKETEEVVDTTTSEEECEQENQKSASEEAKPKSGTESSSEEETQTKKRKRIKKTPKGSSDSSEEEKREKKKKKRKSSSTDSSEDEKGEKRKKGRRNIKKILKKDSLEVETKEALKNEEERKKRLKERQKLFDELFPQEGEQGATKKLILDFDPETKEPLVTVHKKLLKNLKPHQVKGVKFMWDSCFESVQKLEEDCGSGCILAHCMGLGKTLQVVTLVHTVMTHDLGVDTVLVICPLSTVSNWIREFETWLANIKTEPITLYDLVKYKKPEDRLYHLEDWHTNGGVMVLSYELFRILTKVAPNKGKARNKNRKFQARFEKTLIDPGPDLVICDEGHLLKNEDTALSKCVSRMKTSRRIVLTGTPLQNNLIEYHCMVQFVKPNILGTKKEFCNRFVNPINNGQFEDSTELDVKIMKRRSHVLHSMLDGCIQRFDYSVLTPFLPEKHEYVLSIALTETQAKVYSHFLDNFSARVGGSTRSASLFNDYHHLQRIWTHPRTMLMQSDKAAQKELSTDSEGSLKDFVVSGSEEDSETSGSSDESVEEVAPKKRLLRSNVNDPDMQKAIEEEEKAQNKHWWDEFYAENAYDDLRESNKLVILFSLLKHCAQKKDKLLVFSQSLYSLDLIEYFLAKIDENSQKDNEMLCGHRDTWIIGSDYFRLDGSTSSEMRDRWCKAFNKESNTRARLFLISTRAGGLGINLYAANRVVIFDASWNPSHDLQSIFRVYRFGQKKSCFVYRFLSEATMEEKIYERQVTKLSLAHRVVDEHQIERHYTMGNLQELYAFQPTPKENRKIPILPKDDVLADILAEHKEIVVGYHEHDSLLENKQEEELTEEERKAAWKEYEEEKAQKRTYNPGMDNWNEQLMFMQQGQFPQERMPTQFLNPLAVNQMNAGMQATNCMHQDPPSISYQVIRRFILSKGFESFFGLQLLANMLNNILQGKKPSQTTFGLAEGKSEQKPENFVTKIGTDGDLDSEMKPNNVTDIQSLKDESFSSDVSASTVLFNKDTTTDCLPENSDGVVKKEDFFSSDSEYNSSSCATEELSPKKRKKRKSTENPTDTHAVEPSQGVDEEERELEKLLRMTDINPSTRGKEASSSEENEQQKEKEKKNPKPKQDEVTLMDCLDSENVNGSSNPDLEVKEEEGGNNFFSAMNSQVKKAFLLSSDESVESSEEDEEKPESEEEGETEKEEEQEQTKEEKKKQTTKNRRKDDLAEFRVSNLIVEESSEEEGDADSTGKDSSWKEDEVISESSDASVKCVREFVKKKKREWTKNSGPTSESDSGSDIQQIYEKTESSPSKGRKNIKKILKKENLQVETKQALRMETERKKRMKERQELFEKLFSDADDDSKLVLDFDPETKEELVVVDRNLSRQLKPHQRDGVRFMWNCCFESLKRLEEDSGSGCVLAHCMGLGKTLQVISLVHTIFTHNTGVQTVLVMCPLNTIRNWTHEFRLWLKNCRKKVSFLNLMQCKSKESRMRMLKYWTREGGVLIISYEMFRTLIMKDSKALVFSKLLLDPGPDLVVCDEGHVLKNSSSSLSKCISQIKTLRRIILTGTPFQNNLMEYYCMVQFVKPNILGTMKEFRNRFVHPINNGQFEDSTQLDVRLMKRRAHVLHTMLDGFVQRLSYSVLTPYLPEKQEYVISIALTETQENIYRLFIEKCNQEKRDLLRDFHWMQRVWTHPRVMLMHSNKNNDDEFTRDHWGKYLQEEDYDDIRSSGKMVLLFNILKISKEVGDKVLVFSQSLFSLDLIEYFLRKANCHHSSGKDSEIADSWVLGSDYFRLDGSTNSETRDIYCQRFNNVKDKRFRLFLVSTKAGGLGINLVAANRVVVFDVSWNPTHDVQSIFRVYRFGQKKPCFIYRFLAAATLEEKIYKRQVTKLSLAHRILDEHQIERHYKMGNLQELYTYDPIPKSEWKLPKIPKDSLFADILAFRLNIIVGYHEHDSLLENKEEEELTEEERRAAWEDFEKEKLTPVYPKTMNGNPGPPVTPNSANRGVMQVVYDKPTTSEISEDTPSADSQMCKIVDVRTLHNVENIYRRDEIKRLLELGHSFGLQQFSGESADNYYARIDDTLKRIYPWGIPQGVIKGSANNINEI